MRRALLIAVAVWASGCMSRYACVTRDVPIVWQAEGQPDTPATVQVIWCQPRW